MGVFGTIVVYTVVWWLIFFVLLPVGVERPETHEVAPGHDPGAPRQPMLWRKALGATVIAAVLVGAVHLADDRGWVDFRALIVGGEP